MSATKQGPLYDAARMLRLAARRLEAYADNDARVSSDIPRPFLDAQRRRISEATTNINAAVARIHPYDR